MFTFLTLSRNFDWKALLYLNSTKRILKFNFFLNKITFCLILLYFEILAHPFFKKESYNYQSWKLYIILNYAKLFCVWLYLSFRKQGCIIFFNILEEKVTKVSYNIVCTMLKGKVDCHLKKILMYEPQSSPFYATDCTLVICLMLAKNSKRHFWLRHLLSGTFEWRKLKKDKKRQIE